jgi:hypothetical protein
MVLKILIQFSNNTVELCPLLVVFTTGNLASNDFDLLPDSLKL